RIATDVGLLRAYAVLGFISSDFHRLGIGAFELRHAQAVVWVIAYGDQVLRIRLATLCGSGNFGLCTCRRGAQPHRSRQDEKSTHGNLLLRYFLGGPLENHPKPIPVLIGVST